MFYGLGCLLLLFLWQAVMAIMNPSVRSKPDDTGSAFIGQQVVNPANPVIGQGEAGARDFGPSRRPS